MPRSDFSIGVNTLVCCFQSFIKFGLPVAFFSFLFVSTLKALKIKIAEFANIIDPDELALKEFSQLVLAL